jgi:hypothetical protein
MADRNSKRSPTVNEIQVFEGGCWVCSKSVCNGVACNILVLNPALIAELILDMTTQASMKESDSKRYNPEELCATDNKNWIMKVEYYLDSRTGKSGMPLINVFQPASIDPAEAPVSAHLSCGRHNLKLNNIEMKIAK